MSAHSVWPVAARLGEAGLWSPHEATLWFVDMKYSSIHRLLLRVSQHNSWPAPARAGFIVPAATGRLIIEQAKPLAALDPAAGTFAQLPDVEPHRPDDRVNGCTVNPGGAYLSARCRCSIGRPLAHGAGGTPLRERVASGTARPSLTPLLSPTTVRRSSARTQSGGRFRSEALTPAGRLAPPGFFPKWNRPRSTPMVWWSRRMTMSGPTSAGFAFCGRTPSACSRRRSACLALT